MGVRQKTKVQELLWDGLNLVEYQHRARTEEKLLRYERTDCLH